MIDHSYLGLAINSIPIAYELLKRLSDYLKRHKIEDKSGALDPLIEAYKDLLKFSKKLENLIEIVKENLETLRALLKILEALYDLQDKMLQIILSLISKEP